MSAGGVRWVERDALDAAAAASVQPADVVLDIGCGIRPQQLVRPVVHICCEPFGEYVDHLRMKTRLTDDRYYIFLQASWAQAVTMFPARSVDTVCLLDVIEHIDKAEATALLPLTVALARRQVLVFTPLGFVPQEHPDGRDAWGLGGGAWQTHRSGWDPAEFADGWDIVASRDYHRTDNRGRALTTAYGAFWAIKTLPGPPASLRRRVHRFVHGRINATADALLAGGRRAKALLKSL